MDFDLEIPLYEILSAGNLAELIDDSTLARIGQYVKRGVDIED